MTSRFRTTTITLAAALLLISNPVPLFAFREGNDPPESERDAAAAAGRPHSLPHNLIAPRMLRPLLLSMLGRSATFRRQCRRIGASPALVEIRLVPRYVVGTDRSLSTVKKYQYGFTTALVQIAAPCNCAELIGHELEHIIEQIEGIDLPDLVQRKGAGVSVDEVGAFETERARKTGRSVADEFEEMRPQPRAFTGVIKQ